MLLASALYLCFLGNAPLSLSTATKQEENKKQGGSTQGRVEEWVDINPSC